MEWKSSNPSHKEGKERKRGNREKKEKSPAPGEGKKRREKRKKGDPQNFLKIVKIFLVLCQNQQNFALLFLKFPVIWMKFIKYCLS